MGMETQEAADALFAQISEFQHEGHGEPPASYRPLYYRAVLRRVDVSRYVYDKGNWEGKKDTALLACQRLRDEGFPDRCILLERLEHKSDPKGRAKHGDYDPEWRIVRLKQ